MPEQIGALVPTQIPALTEVADIQEALRLYHYGRPSGSGANQYDPTNTNPGLLNPTGNTPSIAWYLTSLQSQITNVSGSLGVQPTTWNAKGAIVTATAASNVVALAVGTNGQVLTANSGTASGLQWSSPEVTLSNSATLTNKNISLGTNSISGTISEFNAALTNGDFLTTTGTETLTNKTIDLQSNTLSGTLSQFNTALSDAIFATTATPQTLSNKTIAFGSNTISGTFSQLNAAITDATLVSTTASQLLTNKTLLTPVIDTILNAGLTPVLNINSTGGPSYLRVSSSTTTPSIDSIGTATNISINMVPKGTGRLQEKGVNVITANQLILAGAHSTSFTPGNTPVVTNSSNPANITLSNVGAFVRLTSGLSNPNVNLPASAAIGSTISFVQGSNTNHNFVAPSGENILATPGTRLRAMGSVATAVKVTSTQWALFGDLIA